MAEAHEHGHGTTQALRQLAESISGKQLDGLLHKWLYERGKPEYNGSKAAAPAGRPPSSLSGASLTREIASLG